MSPSGFHPIRGDHTVRLNSLIHDDIVPTYENTMGHAYLRTPRAPGS
jgi:hypothetical protein